MPRQPEPDYEYYSYSNLNAHPATDHALYQQFQQLKSKLKGGIFTSPISAQKMGDELLAMQPAATDQETRLTYVAGLQDLAAFLKGYSFTEAYCETLQIIRSIFEEIQLSGSNTKPQFIAKETVSSLISQSPQKLASPDTSSEQVKFSYQFFGSLLEMGSKVFKQAASYAVNNPIKVMLGALAVQATAAAAQTSQPQRWVKTLGGIGIDNGQSVELTSDGGYIVTGSTSSFPASDAADLWLSKWTANGTLNWVKTLGGGGDDKGYSVQQTSDGGYIVTGSTSSFWGHDVDLWLSKWSANGTLTWVKTLGYVASDVGTSVQQTSDGGYIVTGYTQPYGTGSSLTLWLSKWTADGTLAWVKTLGGAGNDIGNSVQSTSDGGYIVTGSTSSFGAGNPDLWLSKWAADGTLSWVKTLGGTGSDFGTSVQQTSDGGYIVTGYAQSFGAGSFDLWLSKWAADGTLTWVKTLGGTGYDYGYSVQQTSDGGYIVTGYTTSFGAGTSNSLWLSKWTSDGTLSWVKILDGTGDDYGYSVQQTHDGGYIVTGSTSSFGAGRDDLLLSKWDSQGNIGSKCISQMNINAQAVSINAANAGATSSNWSIISKNPVVSAQTVNPTLLTACRDAPILSSNGGNFTYTEGDPATAIDLSIVVTDNDSKTLSSAIISISDGFASNEDVLGFMNQNSITGHFNTITGVLTLSGNSDLVNYQAALRNVTYQNTSENPSLAPRTFSFIVNDGQLNSNTITRQATIVAVDNAPTLSNNGGSFTYTEGDPATAIDQSILVTDVDSTTLTNATINISSGFASDEDVLGFTNQNGITGHYNNVTGILTLKGNSSLANYQAALRRVTYQNTSKNPSTAPRIFSFMVNDGQLNSNTITRQATIVAVDNAPALSNNGGSFTYTEGEPPVTIDQSIVVTDIDSTTLASATISVSGGFAIGEDVLGFIDQHGITGHYNSATGVMTLSGNSSLANYQAALRSVTYQNTSENPSLATRTFSFMVNDGQLNSNTITRQATIVAVDNAPTLSNVGGNFTYTEGDPATAIDQSILVTDLDSPTLANATISISSGFVSSEDVLGFIDKDGITGHYSQTTGILTLSGDSSLANYQMALRSVTYFNSADNPSLQSRTFNFTVNDGQLNSNTITRGVLIKSNVEQPGSNNTGIIAGVVAAGAGSLLIGMGVGYYFWRKRKQAQTDYQALAIEIVSPDRMEKGYTIISERFALINKINQDKAKVLYEQTGIEVTFSQGQKKEKFSLGQGQFGKLRLAQDIETQEFLGVKKIKGAEEIAASEDEAHILTQLVGIPQVIQLKASVRTVGSDRQPVLYQFMELAGFGSGETLQACLSQLKDPVLKLKVLVHVAKGLLTGFSQMQDKQQICHLDIKPSNFVLTKEGDVKIIDFGCAKFLSEGTNLVSGGNGDTRYYSPDRLAHCRYQQEVTELESQASFDAKKADSWALGVTLLELATGLNPFASVGIADKMQHWDTAYVTELLTLIPELKQPAADSFWAVVKGLLEPHPKQRLSAREALASPIFHYQKYQFSSKDEQHLAFVQLKAMNIVNNHPSSVGSGASLSKQHNQNYSAVYFNNQNADQGLMSYGVGTSTAAFFKPASKVNVASQQTYQVPNKDHLVSTLSLGNNP